MRHARGSLWRRWDLHVHTPASIIHRYRGSSEDAWAEFLTGIENLPREFKVIGINDYIFLDGYCRVLEERERGRLQNIELFLPVIELRLDRFGGASQNKLSRVNYHVIFSDALSPETIQHQFINGLRAECRLNPESQCVTWRALPTRDSLSELGRQIVDSVPQTERHRFGSPLQEGFNNLNFSLGSVRDVLQSTYFTDKYVTAVGKTEWEAVQWNDNTIADKKDVINGAGLVFTSAESVEKCLEGRAKLQKAGVNARLLDCSDAHACADAGGKDRLGKCFTWISGDTEFEGLLRAVAEYDDRVYIGTLPDKLHRVATNRTRYARGVSIARTIDSPLAEPWLDGVAVEFNHGLVALIGNKGSGKSALLDVMGLLGDSTRHSEASFLSKDRFRHPADNKARCFDAVLQWEDGLPAARGLDEEVPVGAVERLTYIPQRAFETICNELGSGEPGQFDAELKRVIFSHVGPAERLGCATLDDLLEFRASEIQAAITQRREELALLNRDILQLEYRTTAGHIAALDSQLDRRRAELSAHDMACPADVPEPPGDADPATQRSLEEIAARQQDIEHTDAAINIAGERVVEIRRQLEVLDRVRQRIDTFVRRYDELTGTTRTELAPLGIEIDDLVAVTVDVAVLERAAIDRREELATIDRRVGRAFGVLELSDDEPTDEFDDFPSFIDDNAIASGAVAPEVGVENSTEETLTARRERLSLTVNQLRSSLDTAHAKRQAFLQETATWQVARELITGEPEAPGSIAGIEAAIRAVGEIPDTLVQRYEQRREIARDVLVLLSRVAALYRAAYAPVQRFITDHAIARDVFNLRFDAAIVDTGFEDRLWDWINRGRVGSFLGQQEGTERVRQLLAKHNFDDIDRAIAFAEAISDHLRHDRRTSAGMHVRVADQIKTNRTEETLFDFIYGFEYLECRFGLRMGDRELHQLSPGEKGALLLVFYLLVDQGDGPLLIDQPEENLDNQTVVSLLVPSIRAAKRRRQIFIVTHNPNLAVVCGADQIICAEREPGAVPRFRYVSGAVENPVMNRKVVDVLEGTKRAFNFRGASYFDYDDTNTRQTTSSSSTTGQVAGNLGPAIAPSE